MTDREELELRRLEVNVQRLIERLTHQSLELRTLRSALDAEREKNKLLEQELTHLRQEAYVTYVASLLQGDNADVGSAEAYLSQIISEIEYCIKQLEQD